MSNYTALMPPSSSRVSRARSSRASCSCFCTRYLLTPDSAMKKPGSGNSRFCGQTARGRGDGLVQPQHCSNHGQPWQHRPPELAAEDRQRGGHLSRAAGRREDTPFTAGVVRSSSAIAAVACSGANQSACRYGVRSAMRCASEPIRLVISPSETDAPTLSLGRSRVISADLV